MEALLILGTTLPWSHPLWMVKLRRERSGNEPTAGSPGQPPAACKQKFTGTQLCLLLWGSGTVDLLQQWQRPPGWKHPAAGP